MANDGFIQVAVDGAGKKMETTELTRADGTVIERERVAIGNNSGLSDAAFAEVRNSQLQVGSSELRLLIKIDETLEQILFVLQAALK